MIALCEKTSRRRAPSDPDAQLMMRVRAGSTTAFTQLAQRYQPLVVQAITHRMGNDRFSEDLAQEVFLRVFRARRTYVVRSKFATWLATIVNNVVSNARRGLARRPETSVESVPATDAAWKHDGSYRPIASPTQMALEREARAMVHVAMQGLNERERTAVRQYYFEGLPHKVIARNMQTSQAAIKSLLHRARISLRESLGSYHEAGDLVQP